MSELSIRRELNIASRFEKASKAERRSAAGTQAADRAQQAPAVKSAISEGLQRLMGSLGRTASQLQHSRGTLQAGEGTLAEAQDLLSRMSKLAKQALSGEASDRAGLQSELETLLGELDRVLKSACFEGESLFQGEDAQVYESLADDLAELLRAVQADPSGQNSQAAESLRQMLARLTGGSLMEQLPPGQAAADLPALDLGSESVQKLMDLLFGALSSDGGLGLLGLGDAASLSLLSGLDGAGLNALLGALTALQVPAAGTAAAQQQVPGQQLGGLQVSGQDLSGVAFDPEANVLTVGGSGDVVIQGAKQGEQAAQGGEATRPAPTILLAGSGSVTLHGVDAGRLVVQGGQARLVSSGENTLGEVVLGRGATLTLGGEGALETEAFRADRSNTLILNGSALAVGGGDGELGEGVTVRLDHAASLAAWAQTAQLSDGGRAEPFDAIWKALLPGWKSVDALAVDGRTQMSLFNAGERPEAARLWLERGDPTRGHPIHTVMVTGRDELDQPKTRSVWLQWDERSGSFRQINMYPNPFTVTGGSAGTDWTYDESSQTLCILTAEVTQVSGGAGLDAEQNSFSGRLAFRDNLGQAELTLGGVTCLVSSGKALDLGRENQITLFLPDGADNIFVSGQGCAGICVGDGTGLVIDKAPEPPEDEAEEDGGEAPDLPPGTLTATGGDGGAGIGRSAGYSWDRISTITILGGIVTASGTGGGAGIGAGKYALMGGVLISGGTVSAAGGPGGGAGIGGGLGGPVGDIEIRGGTISASAVYHAAAIGAGVEGACGNITIKGSAHIKNAQGGDPETSIGPCRFGSCGTVDIAPRTLPGGAPLPLQRQEDTPLPQENALTNLPRFVITPRMLRLHDLDLTTFEEAWAAEGTLNAASRHVALVQGIYNALSGRLEGDGAPPVRDAHRAGELLSDARSAILSAPAGAPPTCTGQSTDDVLQLLRDAPH